jgi:alkylation response protein AidB-like acyl-CoA dehydrogenase
VSTEFRAELRKFLDTVGPEIDNSDAPGIERARQWRAALYDAGYAGLGYDTSYGGHGLDPDKLKIWQEESRGSVPGVDATFGIGVGMALPTIRDFGTDELKERFIEPGLRGEEIWCQLYSEPEAGSDLASLRTTAVLDGDEWIINGQKVWTSGAQHSQLAILLARTDRDAAKHKGITMFILPMEQPGVEVRPLVQMTGVAEFNEVFMTDARLPRSWVVGEVNNGWRTAVALLGHERVQTGTASVGDATEVKTKTGRKPLPFGQLVDLAQTNGRAAEPLVRQDLATIYTGEKLMGWLGQRKLNPSLGKLWRTRQGRLAADLAGRLAFPAGVAFSADDDELDYWSYHILNCRGMSLGGGTDEIQRNTLGERVLGLPREPRPQTP